MRYVKNKVTGKFFSGEDLVFSKFYDSYISSETAYYCPDEGIETYINQYDPRFFVRSNPDYTYHAECILMYKTLNERSLCKFFDENYLYIVSQKTIEFYKGDEEEFVVDKRLEAILYVPIWEVKERFLSMSLSDKQYFFKERFDFEYIFMEIDKDGDYIKELLKRHKNGSYRIFRELSSVNFFIIEDL